MKWIRMGPGMGAETGITWTDHTFNPWWGCARVSPGCEHCYAETWDRRWGESHWGAQAPRRFFNEKHWNEPRKWNRAAEAGGRRARVFCASMADVFEDRRDLDDARNRLLALIGETPHLDWQLLTKRPENMVHLAPPSWAERWPANVWAGTTVEDQQRADERIPHLLRVPAAVRFLSCEPLLGPVDLGAALRCPRDHNRDGDCDRHPRGCPIVGWVIVGGESGPGARPMDLAWASRIVRDCKNAGVPVFVKQFGARPFERAEILGGEGHSGKDLLEVMRAPQMHAQRDGWTRVTTRAEQMLIRNWRLRDPKGGDPSEWPEDLRVREWPRKSVREIAGALVEAAAEEKA